MMRFIQVFITLLTATIVSLVVMTIALVRFHFILPVNFYVVSSGSMEPALATGGVVVVQQAVTYGVGDIITFYNNTSKKNLVTHRVVAAENSGEIPSFITKGDANKTSDPQPVSGSTVVGKVIFTLPYLGGVLARAKTPVGFIFLVIVPATIIVYEELKTIYNELSAFLKRIFRKSTKPVILTKSDELFLQSVKLMRQEEGVRIDPLIGIVLVICGAGMVFIRGTFSLLSDSEHTQVAYAVTRTQPSSSPVNTSPASQPVQTPIPTSQTQLIPEASGSGFQALLPIEQDTVITSENE